LPTKVGGMEIKMKEIKNILFFIKYIKPQWKTLLTVIVLTIVATGIGLYLPIINSNLVDKGILAKNFDYVLNISIIYTLAYVVKGFIGLLISSLTAIMNSKIRFKMNQDVFKEIERFKLSYFQNNDPTMIYNNITTDINNVSKLFDGNLLNVFTQMLYLIGGITCVFMINYKLALVAIAIIPIKYFSINFFSKKNKVLTKEYLSIHTDYARWFQDTIQGIRDIKVFNLYEKKENEFSKVKTKFIKYERMFSIISSAKEEFDNFITQFIIIIIYILGTFFIIKNELTYGTIVAFLTYLVYVSTPISYLTNIKFIFSGIIPSAKRLKEIFETEKEIYNQKIPVSVLKEDSIIELKGVSYSFADKKLIDDIDLTFKVGEIVALVGDNGSGKTTIGNLLLRFIEPNEGAILLDGINIKEMDLNSYREMFAVADAKSHLFQERLSYNINFNEKEIDEIDDIIQKSQLKNSEIVLMRSQLKLCESNVSSGEKQKIIIARVFYADKQISIFDEATANLDKKSRENIEEVMVKNSKNSLKIIITHSKDILQYVDQIVMLHEGKVTCFENVQEAEKNKNFNKLFAKK
jgi:ABC-type bacteriocin/lantibiotic exporter with double-glycine peptidase domain